MAEPFTWGIEELDNHPTLPAVELVRMRTTEAAKAFADAERQGYIEASVVMKALELLKQVLAMLPIV